MNGVEATRRIVTSGTAPRVLLLTTFDLDEYAYAGLRAGASGFLLKLVQPGELVAAIRAVASGDAVVAPSVTRRLLDTFGPHLPDPAAAQTQTRATDHLLSALTEREPGSRRSRHRPLERRDRRTAPPHRRHSHSPGHRDSDKTESGSRAGTLGVPLERDAQGLGPTPLSGRQRRCERSRATGSTLLS